MDDHIPVGRGFDRLAALDPDAVALHAPDGDVTRAELAAASNRAAREFRALGVRQDDLVTIGLGNGFPFYAAVLGAWKLGAVPQPVSAKLPPAELSALLEIAGSPVVVGLAAADRPSLPPDWRPDPAQSADPLPPALPPSWKAPTSGGSTGRPKIIVAGQPGWTDAVTERAERLRIGGPGDVFAVTAPLYHNAPFMFSLIALLRGCPLLVLDRFDGAHVLEAVSRHRVHWFYAVPTLMGRILRLPEEVRAAADLSGVQTLLHVGAPCPEPVKRAWIDWLGPEKVVELYAGTESQAGCQIDGVEWLAHPGSVGRTTWGEIRIGDEEARPLPVGEVGEVWMRYPPDAVPYRYLGAIARAHDGWETIGDLGHMDADGYLYLADRRSDLILVGGSNVYPAEVEAALADHPRVLSCCVIGLPDEDLGARVHALVQVDGAVSDEDLRAHVAARLTANKVPRTWERVEGPLREDTGKVRRSALRAARLHSQ
ncbi:AMP-binding protein [Pseudonocardia sp. KRD-184]|uniref:AMP-binding protein n=1 Tax=Pseudonocardia oceani TaxID=2792013 RepID=A0ABS6UCD7_9PSEU|nr:AMP-binding protein [Pseudonocardia oceani]MBW0090732.1 AMP-binding protein [Pseudonocardia oceani]MBW0095156.1 AMP-binding protein [Pseudonocardia oceani]MBW0107562.1 AMP-binding protein [Pseudonocardia oceani]MBW0120603.1 AMP-binding protein [Pseudonocardia oceani]MBW0129880.1 AMP-binding protein [Pseudonocardia oceani]